MKAVKFEPGGASKQTAWFGDQEVTLSGGAYMNGLLEWAVTIPLDNSFADQRLNELIFNYPWDEWTEEDEEATWEVHAS